ncbi:MAG TPA: hypothetical protein VNM90_25195, partial [Haliangium sp.]|nr:hypothetical protein [Haliangium sp.]
GTADKPSPPPGRPRSTEVGDAITEAALATPAPGTPGHVALRLTGLDEGGQRVPLGGVRVRMTSGSNSTEAVTDALGHAQMAAPGEDAFHIEALAPDGTVVAKVQSRLPAGKPAMIPLTVDVTPALADSFARGRAWRADIDQRAARMTEPVRPSATAQPNPNEDRIARLEATVARLERTIAAFVKNGPASETSSGGEGEAPLDAGRESR